TKRCCVTKRNGKGFAHSIIYRRGSVQIRGDNTTVGKIRSALRVEFTGTEMYRNAVRLVGIKQNKIVGSFCGERAYIGSSVLHRYVLPLLLHHPKEAMSNLNHQRVKLDRV